MEHTDLNLMSQKIRTFSRAELRQNLSSIPWVRKGKVCDIVGTVVVAHLPDSSLGTVVNISLPKTPHPGEPSSVLAEVVGFKDEKALLIPFSNLSGISPGCDISGQRILDRVQVGDFLLGKVIDPFMRSLHFETIQIPEKTAWLPLEKEAPNPMLRTRIEKPLSLGVRAIDGLLTFGEGQRIGIMSGSGVGKSVLMGMVARGSAADVNVIGLIGERGREVKEFLERDLGPQGLSKSIVVVVTSDQSPLMRIRGAKVVTTIAEYFAGIGKRVLLMMDSLTRVAMAQREIGLAIGEAPTTKGYPPSVFSLLPRLLERCGQQGTCKGSISGLYTVLVDGDDFNDPMPDAARAILDGHINLSRTLASKGHFPAIEITSSTSRVMHDIASKDHWSIASRMRALLGVYQENFDYVQIGTYQPGTNPLMDEAIQLMPAIEKFLRQDLNELSTLDEAINGLSVVLNSRTQG